MALFCHHGTAGVQGAAILTSPAYITTRFIFGFPPLFLRCLDRLVNAKLAEIAQAATLMYALSEPDTSKAKQYFERAVAVARQQQAKSWELRASMAQALLQRETGCSVGIVFPRDRCTTSARQSNYHIPRSCLV